MRVHRYVPPNHWDERFGGHEPTPDHQWFIDVTGDEYLELAGQLKGMSWTGSVKWYPEYFPGQHLTDTSLRMQIAASCDRDATLIKLLL